jgi:hypothetical protein
MRIAKSLQLRGLYLIDSEAETASNNKQASASNIRISDFFHLALRHVR